MSHRLKCSFMVPALLIGLWCFAQDASMMAKKAGQLQAAGNYETAGALYESAARAGEPRHAYLNKAAECYYRIRDYAHAAACYTAGQESDKTDELINLHYARSLKQSGRYPEAIKQFDAIARQTTGDRKALIMGIVANEIKGCELGMRFQADPQTEQSPETTIALLPAKVNSPANEFGLASFADQLLYFSVQAAGQVRLMRTYKSNNTWKPAVPASGLPSAITAHFGSGAFSPDGRRFYFTQCQETSTIGLNTVGADTHCEIYMMSWLEDNWLAPERLPDYVNLPGTTNLYPFATQAQGWEYVYFSSDRPGGFGGMDLYVTKRKMNAQDLDFTLPKNLGNRINSPGDEITPYFDPSTKTLWFSSNGLPSIGGLDIFTCTHNGFEWNKPENAGLPFNSPADDFFFYRKKSRNGGFLVSNRLFGPGRTSTRDQDIFEFFQQ